MSKEVASLASHFPPDSQALLVGSGAETVKRAGMDAIRGVVLNVLKGKNLRDSTEPLTRRRLSEVTLALVATVLEASKVDPQIMAHLPDVALRSLSIRRRAKSDTWIAQWSLGLNNKSYQNVLRDDAGSLKGYAAKFVETSKTAADKFEKAYAPIKAVLSTPEHSLQMDTQELLSLLSMIGAATLAIRGSEKSQYGKLFEKFTLGCLCSVLGFNFERKPHTSGTAQNTFWLSSRGTKRESDATLLAGPGKGVRFDIGFIGRGNSEISLDKVSRFERELDIGGKQFYLATIIIVDKIGKKSRIVEMAKAIDGSIVQMSATLWPQEVAKLLSERVGYSHPIIEMSPAEVDHFLEEEIKKVPLEQFLELAVADVEAESDSDGNQAATEDGDSDDE